LQAFVYVYARLSGPTACETLFLLALAVAAIVADLIPVVTGFKNVYDAISTIWVSSRWARCRLDRVEKELRVR
jgi:hypothetical protein